MIHFPQQLLQNCSTILKPPVSLLQINFTERMRPILWRKWIAPKQKKEFHVPDLTSRNVSNRSVIFPCPSLILVPSILPLQGAHYFHYCSLLKIFKFLNPVFETINCIYWVGQKVSLEDFPEGPVVGSLPLNAGDVSSILSQGTKILQAAGPVHRN